jgi:hypothetical protein
MKSWVAPLSSINDKGKNDDIEMVDTQQTPPWTLKEVKFVKANNFLSFHVHFLQRCKPKNILERREEGSDALESF